MADTWRVGLLRGLHRASARVSCSGRRVMPLSHALLLSCQPDLPLEAGTSTIRSLYVSAMKALPPCPSTATPKGWFSPLPMGGCVPPPAGTSTTQSVAFSSSQVSYHSVVGQQQAHATHSEAFMLSAPGAVVSSSHTLCCLLPFGCAVAGQWRTPSMKAGISEHLHQTIESVGDCHLHTAPANLRTDGN